MFESHMSSQKKSLQELSAFFPVYNEIENCEKMVERLSQVLPMVAETWEIIISDDGSTDGTAQLADHLAQKQKNVVAVHNAMNKGYGSALKLGFDTSRYNHIFFTDGDCQFDVGELPRLVECLDNADIVVGYRISRQDPLYRRIFAKSWNFLVCILFGLKGIRDLNCAFKIIPKKVIDSMNLRSEGAFITAELICKATYFGYRITEVGVKHLPQKKGTGGNFKVILKAFRDLILLYRNMQSFRKKQSLSKDRKPLK
jgi:glycosyltransferase involved in cell wall biosynthesis